MKPDPGLRARLQTEAIARLNSQCEGTDQFANFDRAFCASLKVSKEALLKEEAKQKRARARKRAKKAG